MAEKIVNETLIFIQKCDDDFANNLFLEENSVKAKEYLALLKQMKKNNNSSIVNATIKKLDFIIKQIDAVNYHTYSKEGILNLVSLSVTDYIIKLVQQKHLVEPLLIARYAYIELAKVLYYDISYVRQEDPVAKAKICNTLVNVKKEKIFSYIVCTQWLQLYTYILKQFDIEVIKRSIPGQDHIWGEIKLDDKHIIIVDATDYINSSIDLSNAKSMSPTVGFVVLPKEYSNIKLYDVFHDSRNYEIAKIIKDYYELNRDIDMTLGYITKKGYPVERIIAENELFNYSDCFIEDQKKLEYFLNKTLEFFKKLKIPNNMDGYEVYAYYYTFLKQLPPIIRANISQKTFYVDSYSYKQSKLRKKFLHAPREYLQYLDGLIYSKYYKYLSAEENNAYLEQIRKGVLNAEQVRNSIAKNEMLIAEINRNINRYYAINKLQFFKPYTCETLGIQVYEPMMGVKRFKTQEEFEDFRDEMILLR